jgi:hypothetical protein
MKKIYSVDPIIIASNKGELIEGKEPMEYAVLNNKIINIDGLKYPALHVAIRSRAKINGKDPVVFALSHNIRKINTNDDYDIIAFAHAYDIDVEGRPALEFAIKNNIKPIINGKEHDPVYYAKMRLPENELQKILYKKEKPQIKTTATLSKF